MLLICPNRCGGSLFRALFAEVDIDSGGEYVEHRVTQPAYVCLNCGSPAVDLGEVPREMAAEAEATREAKAKVRTRGQCEGKDEGPRLR